MAKSPEKTAKGDTKATAKKAKPAGGARGGTRRSEGAKPPRVLKRRGRPGNIRHQGRK